jgi:hypothetical protein
MTNAPARAVIVDPSLAVFMMITSIAQMPMNL